MLTVLWHYVAVWCSIFLAIFIVIPISMTIIGKSINVQFNCYHKCV